MILDSGLLFWATLYIIMYIYMEGLHDNIKKIQYAIFVCGRNTRNIIASYDKSSILCSVKSTKNKLVKNCQ